MSFEEEWDRFVKYRIEGIREPPKETGYHTVNLKHKTRLALHYLQRSNESVDDTVQRLIKESNQKD